jgi:NAD(P) transhydrogenase subunit alpha
VVHGGVTILAPLNLSSEMAYHASTMYSKNISALLEHLAPEAALHIDLEDEITRGACVTLDGQVVHEPTRALLNHEVAV